MVMYCYYIIYIMVVVVVMVVVVIVVWLWSWSFVVMAVVMGCTTAAYGSRQGRSVVGWGLCWGVYKAVSDLAWASLSGPRI